MKVGISTEREVGKFNHPLGRTSKAETSLPRSLRTHKAKYFYILRQAIRSEGDVPIRAKTQIYDGYKRREIVLLPAGGRPYKVHLYREAYGPSATERTGKWKRDLTPITVPDTIMTPRAAALLGGEPSLNVGFIGPQSPISQWWHRERTLGPVPPYLPEIHYPYSSRRSAPTSTDYNAHFVFFVGPRVEDVVEQITLSLFGVARLLKCSLIAFDPDHWWRKSRQVLNDYFTFLPSGSVYRMYLDPIFRWFNSGCRLDSDPLAKEDFAAIIRGVAPDCNISARVIQMTLLPNPVRTFNRPAHNILSMASRYHQYDRLHLLGTSIVPSTITITLERIDHTDEGAWVYVRVTSSSAWCIVANQFPGSAPSMTATRSITDLIGFDSLDADSQVLVRGDAGIDHGHCFLTNPSLKHYVLCVAARGLSLVPYRDMYEIGNAHDDPSLLNIEIRRNKRLDARSVPQIWCATCSATVNVVGTTGGPVTREVFFSPGIMDIDRVFWKHHDHSCSWAGMEFVPRSCRYSYSSLFNYIQGCRPTGTVHPHGGRMRCLTCQRFVNLAGGADRNALTLSCSARKHASHMVSFPELNGIYVFQSRHTWPAARAASVCRQLVRGDISRPDAKIVAQVVRTQDIPSSQLFAMSVRGRGTSKEVLVAAIASSYLIDSDARKVLNQLSWTVHCCMSNYGRPLWAARPSSSYDDPLPFPPPRLPELPYCK